MLALLFFAGLSGSTHAAAQSGPTDINVGSTVKTPHAQRLGINISGQSFYDSGQMLRNLISRNPGFEGEIWRSVLRCQSVSGDGCYGDDPWSSWPKNFLVGATVQFVTGPSKGLTGTVSALDPANSSSNTGFLVHMQGLAHAPAAGDYFIVQASIGGNPQAGWWPNLNGGATLAADTTDLSPNSPGKQALQINASGAGQSGGVTSYFDSYNGRSFVQMNGTYTVTFRAKSLGGSNTLNVSVARPGTSHGNMTYFNQNVSLTNQWKDYSYTFTANEDGTYIGTAQVSFTVSGGTVLLDDASLMEEAAPDNPTPFRNAVVERLRQLKPGTLRHMDNGSDFGSTNDNMLTVQFARQRAGYSVSQTLHEDIAIGLEDFLELCQAVGADPWYSIPATSSPQEVQQLIQFLGGSTTTKYGAIRASLGQSAPWTSVFNTIHLEFGNETWNAGSFDGATFNNPVAYAERVQDVFGAAKAAPEYNASKFDLIMNGFGAWSDYNRQELATGVSAADTLDVAPYLFSHLADWSSNEAIFGSMFAEPEAIDSLPTGYMAQDAQIVGSAPHPVKLAVYEVNLGTVDGTASQGTVNAVVPSVGAGLATVEHMLLMMRDNGITVQNLFALPEYANGYTNTSGGGGVTPLWGSVVDMGGQTNLCRPQFLAETLANSAITGDLLETIQTGANPTWNQPTNNNTKVATPNAHYLQSFAFSDGTNHSVIVFNLHRSSALPVTFSGANAPKGNVQMARLTSTNLTDTNEQKNVVAPTTAQISNFDPSVATSLPPFSMTVFTWNGSVSSAPPAQATTSQLTATPTQLNTGQTVTLTAKVTAASGTPDGSVTLLDGSTSLGTAALVNGSATLSTTTLSAGTHTISFAYAGDSSFLASTSQPVTVTVTTPAPTVASTSTLLSATPAQTTVGQTITLQATVSSSGGTPNGTVNFLQSGSQVLGTATLVNGKASLAMNTLSAGAHTLTAQFAGNSSFTASTSQGTVVLLVSNAPASTVTQLSATPTQATVGQAVTVVASVTSASGNPSGLVNFLQAGSLQLGSASVVNGKATLTLNGLSIGTHTLSAQYGGNSSFAASSSQSVSVTLVSAAAASTTAQITATPSQITVGQPETLSAVVTSMTGVPSGQVNFLSSTTIIGTTTLVNGRASLTTSTLPLGSDSISVSYSGDTSHASSVSSPVTVTVSPSGTETSLGLSATQLAAGSPFTLTAKVQPTSGPAPTGSVNFYLGSTLVGTSALTNGVATTSATTPSTSGSYQVSARYTGSASDTASTSAQEAFVVVATPPAAVGTVTTMSVSPANAVAGQAAVLTATVSPATGATIPDGVVHFFIGSVDTGAAPLVDGTATLAITAPTTGSYLLKAQYEGSATDSASASVNLTWNVTAPAPGSTPVATTTTLALSSSTVTSGVPVTLSVQVISADGATLPAGSVQITGAPVSLAPLSLINGVAAMPLTLQSTGSYTLQANFIGDGVTSASSSSVPVTLTVTAAAETQPIAPPSSNSGSIALSLSQQSIRLSAAQASPVTVQVTPEGGFQQTVSLACQGLPPNVACSFASPALAVAGQPASTTMMLSTASTTAQNTNVAGLSGIAYGAMLPWNLIGMLATAAARRRRQWGALRTVCLLLLMGVGAMAMTGCGVTYGTTAQTYHATVTASVNGSVVQTATFDVVVQEKTAPF